MYVGRSLLGAMGVALLATTACGGSGYQYVENEDLGVFARLPDDYEVYDTEALIEAVRPAGEEPLSDAATERALARVWFRGFDSSTEPSAEGAMELGASEPRGFVQVQQLTREERDQINVTGLRSAVLGIDPVVGVPDSSLTGSSGQAAEAEVLVDEPATFDGGYHGVHNVFAVPGESAGEVAIVDQTALLDETSSTLYLFVVSCDETCYFENSSDTVKEIVDSWTIQEARS